MNSRKSLFRQFFSIQIFGFVLGGGVFAVFLLLSLFTQVPNRLETRILDIHFTLKRSSIRSREQENVVVERHSPKISRDILIVGIDSRTLNVLGSWPFPRSSHADLLNSFARIQNQNEREAVILLDFLFTEKALDPTEDAALVEAIKGNGRVALQSQVFGLPLVSARENDHNNRLSVLLDRLGNISNVRGNTNKVVAYYGIESPLVPLGETIAAHGHASFRDDFDAVYRRQQIVIRYGQKIGEISLDELTADTKLNFKNNKGHLAWVKKTGQIQPMVFPLTSEELALVKKKIRRYGAPRIDSSGTASWYLTIYQDYYIPAITLSLALRYFNRTLDEVEVVYGSHIRIPEPLKWNAKTSQWEPYSIRGKQLNEIKIR